MPTSHSIEADNLNLGFWPISIVVPTYIKDVVNLQVKTDFTVVHNDHAIAVPCIVPTSSPCDLICIADASLFVHHNKCLFSFLYHMWSKPPQQLTVAVVFVWNFWSSFLYLHCCGLIRVNYAIVAIFPTTTITIIIITYQQRSLGFLF